MALIDPKKREEMQRIFNTVRDHLLAQGKRALSGDNKCAYRNGDNLTCAVGCLIPEDKYDPRIEQWSIFTLKYQLEDLQLHGRNLVSSGCALLYDLLGRPDLEIVGLLEGLQQIHDQIEPKEWAAYLHTFATNRDLTP